MHHIHLTNRREWRIDVKSMDIIEAGKVYGMAAIKRLSLEARKSTRQERVRRDAWCYYLK